jgi:hypothetical protein
MGVVLPSEGPAGLCDKKKLRCAKLNRLSFETGDKRYAHGLKDMHMGTHLPVKRLLDVAISDDLIFDMDEFNHLEECRDCLTTWVEFNTQWVRENEMDSQLVEQRQRVLDFRKPNL